MPNWACGSVSITGTKSNVVSFVSRFIHDEGVETDQKHRFFARSFTNDKKQSVLDAVEEAFQEIPADAEYTFDLAVDFAWSAHSCLIDGYPQDNSQECITLSIACIADRVSVEITTEECGMCFTEYITCDKTGDLTSECEDFQEYKCKNCGEVMSLSPSDDPEEAECFECENLGFEPI